MHVETLLLRFWPTVYFTSRSGNYVMAATKKTRNRLAKYSGSSKAAGLQRAF